MEICQLDGSEIESLEELLVSHQITIFQQGDLILKVPHKYSTYDDIARDLREKNAEFDDTTFYKAVLESVQKFGIQLPNPWKVEPLLVDAEKRTCFWQEHFRDLCEKTSSGSVATGGVTVGGTLPLSLPPEDLRRFEGGQYLAADFVRVGERKVFFDWDLYFLFLFDKQFSEIEDFSRKRLQQVCNDIEAGKEFE